MLAPTGTIAFLMDCDTTGIEPDIALVKYKLLAGGGMLKIVNRTVPEALRRLGYSAQDCERIIAHIEKFDTIEDVTDGGQTVASGLKPEHLPVFDCAFKPYRGQRSIHALAHLKMMAAAQPFISGAISKTVNMPNDSTVEDIRDAYVQAWKMGLKCVAIYRDGSKRSQPLNTKRTGEGDDKAAAADTSALEARIKELEAEVAQLAAQAGKPLRRRLSDTRTAITHKFDIAGHEGYLTVGLFENKQPGELFITMAKEGSTIGGLMDGIGTLTSLALQYGVPLEALVRKFAHVRFEPSGFTKNPDIRNAASITDYVFRWMAHAIHPRLPGGQFAQSQPAGAGHSRLAGSGEEEDQPARAGAGHRGGHRDSGSEVRQRRQWQGPCSRQARPPPSGTSRTSATQSRTSSRMRPPARTAATSPSATAPATSASTAARAWGVHSNCCIL